MTFKRRIKKLYNCAEQIDLKKESKVFIYSDCHRGAGDKADDFIHNYDLFLEVLKKYIAQGYLLIELGDGDELWENNCFEDILKQYREIYEIYDDLFLRKKFYLIWGNHNRNWKNQKSICRRINSFFNKNSEMKSHEALVLKHGNKSIFLLHGHQGELINDKFWWIGKFLVRIFWRPIQIRFGLPDATSPARNYRARIRVDRRFIKWIKETNIPVMIGHTHRPSIPKKSQVSYFNSGSCVHPEGITGIEIVDEKISLIKWGYILKDGKKNINRDKIGGPFSILSL